MMLVSSSSVFLLRNGSCTLKYRERREGEREGERKGGAIEFFPLHIQNTEK